jgi:hypothetical protein
VGDVSERAATGLPGLGSPGSARKPTIL